MTDLDQPSGGPALLGSLDDFAVSREVGRGASGVVFHATQRATGQPAAIKVVAGADPDGLIAARFLAEGELLAGLVHPAIVRTLGFGTLGPSGATLAGQSFAPETPYLAMEWLEGQDLGGRQKQAPLTLREALQCARQVAAALAAAHDAGVVHRDVKPANIIVMRTDAGEALQVKLLDFGVACNAEDASLLGGMVGTPAYMAPEQARGDSYIDARCDVYALGATLFELIVGHTPHTGPSVIAILAKLVTTPAPRLRDLLSDIPPELDDCVAEMLDPEWSSRPTAAELDARLGELAERSDLPHLGETHERQRESAASRGSRLVTSFVALHVGDTAEREAHLKWLREHGAEAVGLGRDAIVAYLGVRRAHGGEAAEAIELGQRLALDGAQVGVATGRALVDLARPGGDVVDKASALAREASSGRLYADETTAELARGAYDFAPGPGSQWVVGKALPERRNLVEQTPFVGRGSELERLFSAYDRCIDERMPVFVSVSGPPGIGKSRLAREFVKRIGDYRPSLPPATERSAGMPTARPGQTSPIALVHSGRATLLLVQVRCQAFGRARALGTAADALLEMLGMSQGASRRAIEQALQPLDAVYREGGLLARLLAGEQFDAEVDAQRAREILYPAMTELMLLLSANRHCVVLLEDGQWADPESVAWFEHLLSRAARHPLLIMFLARPSFWKDHPKRFGGRSHFRLELRPIPRRATMEIARALIGCDINDPKLTQIAKQAAGLPLFAEELARVIAAGKSPSTIPTIEAAIQVSLDALEVPVRDAVLMMSIFGAATWDDGLAALGVADSSAVLDRLVEADLVMEQGLSRFRGTREFWFKHALVRDVAYASVSDVQRSEGHGKVGAWLAGKGEDAATVAEHYDRSGSCEKAAGYWEIAARRALAANALVDAVKMADRALTFATEARDIFTRATLLDEVYSRLDERAAERLDAIEAMASSAYDDRSQVRTMGARARYDHARSVSGHDVEERLQEAVRRSAELGMLGEQARCLATLATRCAYAGDLAMAEKHSERLLELAGERGVHWAAVDAWQAIAVVRQTRGELAAALEARRSAARAARDAGLKQREAMLTVNLGFALTTIGAKDEARREIEAGIRMAEEVGSAGTVRLGRMLLLGYAAQFGADPSLDEALAEPRESADEAATGAWIVKDRVTLGVLFYRGCELLEGSGANIGRARALLKMSAEAYRQTDNRDVLPVALGHWAEAERRLGELDAAAAIAEEAADLVEAGAPSLLNEAVIYLALHGARVDTGEMAQARLAIERGLPSLLRRLRGLQGTEYERAFLKLSHNARLLEAADAHACLPEDLEPMLA